MKKVLSIILVLALVLSLPIFAVSAASDADKDVTNGYYIVGTMNNWDIRPDYRIFAYDGTEYCFHLFMTPDDSFKIVYSSDGETPDRYYPEGEGNAFNEKDEIIKYNGYYTFVFRSNCDGGKGWIESPVYLNTEEQVWYHDCLICVGCERPFNNSYDRNDRSALNTPATDPGYYVVGSMTDWKLCKGYEVGARSKNLVIMRGDIFKIAYTEDGENITRWYPEGEGNAYNESETRIYTDGQQMYVFFDPDGNLNLYDISGKGAYLGMIGVEDQSMWDCLDPVPIPLELHTGGEYRDAFLAAYSEYDEKYLDYEELYIHRDGSGSPDWVCVWATNHRYRGDNSYSFSIIGNRAFRQYGYRGYPFLTHFGVYDVKQNRFYDPALGGRDGFDPDKYADFDKVMDEYATVDYNSNGRLLGDLDRDDEISVMDVTLIQRCDSEMTEWPEGDAISLYSSVKVYSTVPGYFSDFNRDGSRDILDATCIQRYLSDLPYQVG